MKGKIGKKIIVLIGVISILVFSFWYGGNAPGLQGFSVTEQAETNTSDVLASENEGDISEEGFTESSSDSQNGKDEQGSAEEQNIFQQIVMHIKLKSKASNSSQKTQSNKKAQTNASKAADKEKKKSTTKKKKSNSKKSDKTTEKENSQNTNSESDIDVVTTESAGDTIQCTVYISCATVLDNMDRLPVAKKSIIPKDGVILKETTVQVEKDSTVFDVLQTVTKAHKIHLEYTFTPVYKSYYIEGIYNLYEFDCGNTSGWMYSVNDEFPEDGCSQYIVEDGDTIKWLYSCELGKDVGRYFEE